MRVLIIGYSKIVQKRILPALVQMPNITGIDIASHSLTSETYQHKKDGHIFDNYEVALSTSKAKIVYISTVNSTHAEWAEKALRKGFHVVVDKPAFTTIEDAVKLTELSKKCNLCLAESIVYNYHPQIKLARDVFIKIKSKPTVLTATFSFPLLDYDNFRYKKELGGGALWDLGAYAVTPGRVFFNADPTEVFCQVRTRDRKRDIDTSFSLLAIYSEGRSMVGHFGFNTEYRNHLNILGSDVSVDMDSIFTTPAKMENELRIRQHNKSTILKTPIADSFLIFLQKVIDAIQIRNHHVFAEDLLTDASVLRRMRVAAGEE